jgi:hypothetical protein
VACGGLRIHTSDRFSHPSAVPGAVKTGWLQGARVGILPHPIFASTLVLSTGTRIGIQTRRPTLSAMDAGLQAREAPSVPGVRRGR